MLKEQSHTEELSRAIDALNHNQAYKTDDPHVQELFNTAAYVKKYALSAQDTAIISRISQRIGADLAARKRRKRWLSAVAGAAATVILAANMSFQYPADGVKIADQQPAPYSVAMGDAKEPTEKAPTIVAQPNPNNRPAQIPSNQRAVLERTPAAQGKVSPAVIPAEVKQDQPITVANRTVASENSIMVLPGRAVDAVISGSGMVKHIYGRNTDKEIIVTQRTKPDIATASEPAASSVAALQATDTSRLNKVTRRINGVEITVEGKQTPAELEQIAETLVTADDNIAKPATTEESRKKD